MNMQKEISLHITKTCKPNILKDGLIKSADCFEMPCSMAPHLGPCCKTQSLLGEAVLNLVKLNSCIFLQSLAQIKLYDYAVTDRLFINYRI